MSEFDQHPDAEPPDDPLDQLLRDAAWPEPDGEAVNRLRQHWSALRTVDRKRARRRQLLYWLTASAAAIALVVGVWRVWRPVPDQGRPVAPVVPEPGPERIAVDEAEVNTPDASVPDARNPSPIDRLERIVASSKTSRPANPYELLLIRSIERRSSIRPAVTPPGIDSRIDDFLADPDADAAEFVASLAVDHAVCEQKLLERTDDATSQERIRVMRLLEHVGSQRCIPRLIEWSRSPETRSDAVRALSVLADVATLAELASRETDEQSRRRFLSELLARPSDTALATFLDLLADGRTREAALAVLDEQTMPPVERLFAFMQGPDYTRRWAAAVVLGRLDLPEVTGQLIRFAQSNVNRQEALAGLLASRDEQAGQFLSVAAQDQTMIGAVYSARLQLQLMSQQQSMSQQQWRNLP